MNAKILPAADLALEAPIFQVNNYLDREKFFNEKNNNERAIKVII